MATAELILDAHAEKHDHRVSHHFESAQQQFDAGKLGMWLFLVNEVLFFSGLFVAYAVYRANHPEVFVNAHKYLNTTLGAFNTLVLLISSLTMAWAVRAAQLNQKRLLVWLLAATLSCASLFLGVKAVEYSHKWDKGLLWAGAYAAAESQEAHAEEHLAPAASDHHSHSSAWLSKSLMVLSLPFGISLALTAILFVVARARKSPHAKTFWLCCIVISACFFVGVVFGQVVESYSVHEVGAEASMPEEDLAQQRKYTGVFFSIYYAMTGVHALHILIGMGVIAWLMWRSIRQDFDDGYFGPIDYTALYWHLVDLVWVYLFPLLYLIR